MSGELTTEGAIEALDAVFRKAGRQLYLGLATVALTDASTLATITELSTAGYARQTVGFTAPTNTDPPNTENDATENFGPFTADPPAVQHCFITDASSGTVGKILAYWTGSSVDAAVNDYIRVAAGDLDFTQE